jgi:predicted MPP superfamily phosphohydrolase
VLIWEKMLKLEGPENALSIFMLNIAIPFILFSILVTLLSLPLLLHKGIVFNVLGYTLFYWFLFFPIHLFYGILKKQILIRSLSIPLFAIGIILLSFLVLSLFYYPNQIKKRYLTFQSEKISAKTRIIHLSDVHAENYGSREIKLIEIVNSLNADVILITGDMFIKPYEYNTEGFNAAAKILDQLESRYGIYLVEGHHDYKETHNLTKVLGNAITILNDEWHHFNDIGISVFGATLYSETKQFSREEDNFSIYFSHDPDRMTNLEPNTFNLALFGHTHAGQVYIPVLSHLIVGKYRHGLYHYNNIPIYVSAGIGLEGYLAPRIRCFTYPEVVVIDIEPMPDNN